MCVLIAWVYVYHIPTGSIKANSQQIPWKWVIGSFDQPDVGSGNYTRVRRESSKCCSLLSHLSLSSRSDFYCYDKVMKIYLLQYIFFTKSALLRGSLCSSTSQLLEMLLPRFQPQNWTLKSSRICSAIWINWHFQSYIWNARHEGCMIRNLRIVMLGF